MASQSVVDMRQPENNLFVFKTPEENLAYSLINDSRNILINRTKETITQDFIIDWEEELEWILSDDECIEGCMTFIDCCTLLKWDARRVRNKIIKDMEG